MKNSEQLPGYAPPSNIGSEISGGGRKKKKKTIIMEFICYGFKEKKSYKNIQRCIKNGK